MAYDVLPVTYDSMPLLNRRRVLALLGVGAVAMLAGDAPGFSRPAKVTTYLPTWLSNERYESIQANIELRRSIIDRMHLAFAHFDMADAVVSVPTLAPELRTLVDESAAGMDLSLSLGGGEASEQSWYAVWANPSQYGKSVDDSRRALEDIFQRPVHIDIDCERDLPSNMLTELAQIVRSSLSDQRDLSMAVPAHHRLEVFDTRPTQLGDIVDTFRIMTYDQYGPWSEAAGPIATGSWVLSAVHKWAQKVGDTTKLEIGFPTYGYAYTEASQAGDRLYAQNPEGRSVLYTDLPEASIRDDDAAMTSEAIVDGAWTSCLSPRMIGAIVIELQARYPNFGGSFFWSADGLTSAHLDAVT